MVAVGVIAYFPGTIYVIDVFGHNEGEGETSVFHRHIPFEEDVFLYLELKIVTAGVVLKCVLRCFFVIDGGIKSPVEVGEEVAEVVLDVASDCNAGESAERVQLIRDGDPIDGIGDHIIERNGKAHGGISHYIDHVFGVVGSVVAIFGDAVGFANGDGLVVLTVENLFEEIPSVGLVAVSVSHAGGGDQTGCPATCIEKSKFCRRHKGAIVPAEFTGERYHPGLVVSVGPLGDVR